MYKYSTYCFSVLFLLLGSGLLHGQHQIEAEDQNRFRLGIWGGIGYIPGDLGRDFKMGIGGGGAVLYKYNTDLDFSLSLGYVVYPGKDYEDEFFIRHHSNWQLIPLRTGASYYITEHFYINGSIGIALSPKNTNLLVYSPGIGVHLFRSVYIGMRLDIMNNNLGSLYTHSGNLMFSF